MQKSRNNNGSTNKKSIKKKLSKRTAEFKGLQYSQSW